MSHAKYSPSGMSVTLSCTGQSELIEHLKEKGLIVQGGGSSKAADTGTCAHALHEKCIKTGLDADAFIGKTGKQIDKELRATGAGEIKVTREMADAVQTSVDYVLKVIDDNHALGVETTVETEVYCCLKHLDIEGMEGGTSDVVIHTTDGDLHVIDYKNGVVPVEAVANPQLLMYALGALEKAPTKPTNIYLTIAQPNAYHEQGFVRTYTTTTGVLEHWRDTVLLPTMRKILAGDTQLVPSEKNCFFCPASGHCPAQNSMMMEVAQNDFANLPSVESLTPEQKLKVVQYSKILDKFIKDVFGVVKHEMESGSTEYDQHLKLVRKQSRRKYSDDAEKVLSQHLGTALYEKKMVPFSTLLKQFKGDQELTRLIEDQLVKPEGELTIAPIDDKRKAEKQDDFAGIKK